MGHLRSIISTRQIRVGTKMGAHVLDAIRDSIQLSEWLGGPTVVLTHNGREVRVDEPLGPGVRK